MISKQTLGFLKGLKKHNNKEWFDANRPTYEACRGEYQIFVGEVLEGLKKIDPKSNFEVTTRLRQMILSVNGNYDKKTIREFIEYGLLAKDSRALREHISNISPGVDLKYNYTFDNGVSEDITIPITTNFFWPDA